jgi:hypothetical protein
MNVTENINKQAEELCREFVNSIVSLGKENSSIPAAATELENIIIKRLIESHNQALDNAIKAILDIIVFGYLSKDACCDTINKLKIKI